MNDDENQNVVLNKKVVKEDEIVIDNGQKNAFAKKIINFLSSILTLLIIGFGIYFLMDKNVLPNPFEIKNEPSILEKEKITTEPNSNVNNNLLTYEYPSPCSDGPQSMVIDKNLNSFLFTLYDSACGKTQMEGSAVLKDNKYTFLTTTREEIEGVLDGDTLTVSYNRNTYKLGLKKWK